MNQKIKFIVLGLGAILLISLFSLFSTINSKQVLLREYTAVKERLSRENEALAQKANQALEDKAKAEDKFQAMQKDLERLTREKDDIQKKYELAAKEREGLVDKLKQKKAPTPEEAAAATPLSEDAYWSRILKEKANLEMQVSALKNDLTTIKISFEEANRDKIAMDLEIKNLTREKQALDSRVTYNEKVTDSLSSELVREKKDKRLLQEELKALKSEHSVLLRQLKTLNNQKTSLETRLQDAQQSKSTLENQVKDLNENLDYKLSQVMDVKKDLQHLEEGTDSAAAMPKSSIELPPIVVRSSNDSVQPAQKYTGKVLAVNKENNFIIVDLGEEQGVKPGVKFDVYHNEERIASVEAMQTRRNVSACDIKHTTASISVGDEVK